jgi:8-oxo-dGTP pyrophosphatase MutT (NUDIX family)
MRTPKKYPTTQNSVTNPPAPPRQTETRAMANIIRPSSTISLKPSEIVQLISPKIASVLASFSDTRTSKRGGEHKSSSSSTSSRVSQSIELINELKEWQTPDLPILSSRQLELSLAEIQRRKLLRQQATPSESSISSQKREAAIFVPLCTVQGTPSVLFTRRSSQLSTHASEISFPGGNYDEALDSSGGWKNKLVNTALREMQEELLYDIDQIGLDVHANCFHENDDDRSRSYSKRQRSFLPFLTVLGQTQPVPSSHGTKVTPFVGAINYDLPPCTSSEFSALFPGNLEEVDYIFTVPLSQLISNETSEPLQRWSTNYSDDTNSTRSVPESLGPVFHVPDSDKKKNGDKIWGFTAIVLRSLLRKVFRPVFGDAGLGAG